MKRIVLSPSFLGPNHFLPFDDTTSDGAVNRRAGDEKVQESCKWLKVKRCF